MQNGPELWDAILRPVHEAFPGHKVVIGGGAVRDYLLGFEPKDIDVFVLDRPGHNFIQDPNFLYIEPGEGRKGEYDGKQWVQFVSDYEAFGFPIQVIGVTEPTGQALVDAFDLGITRCWYEDGEIHDTINAQIDRDCRAVTVILHDRLERSMDRAQRFIDRHAGAITMMGVPA